MIDPTKNRINIKNGMTSFLEAMVFNNNQTQKTFLHLPIIILINQLNDLGLEIPIEVIPGSSMVFQLLQKRCLMVAITPYVKANHRSLNYINDFAIALIEANPDDCRDHKESLVRAYQILVESGFFTKKLEIQVSNFNTPLFTFLKNNIETLPTEEVVAKPYLEQMTSDAQNYLLLGDLIIKYLELCQSTTIQVPNKPPTSDMHVEDILPDGMVPKPMQSKQQRDDNLLESTSLKKSAHMSEALLPNSYQVTPGFPEIDQLPSSTVTSPQVTSELPTEDTESPSTNSQNLESIIESMSKKQRGEADRILTTRRDGARTLITIRLENLHLLSYLSFKKEVLKFGPSIDAAYRLQFKEDQIPAKLVEEQSWLYANSEHEQKLVQRIVNQLRNGQCKLLRKQMWVDSVIVPYFVHHHVVYNILITGIPLTVPNLMAFTNDILTNADLFISNEHLATLDQVNSCIPIADTIVQNGQPSTSIQSLFLQLQSPLPTKDPYRLATTTSRYQVATTLNGQPVLSRVTVAINLMSEAWTRDMYRTSSTIAAIRGPALQEGPLLAPFLQQGLHDSLNEGLSIVIVPVYTVNQIVVEGKLLRVNDTILYYLVQCHNLLTAEVIDNIRTGLGIPKSQSNNIIRVQGRNLEIRWSISDYHQVGMPTAVVNSQKYMEITGCQEVTSEHIYAVLSADSQKGVAYITVLQVKAQKPKSEGTHIVYIVWKASVSGNPDLMWFSHFRSTDGGKLNSSQLTFGYPSKAPSGPGSKGYNFFHLSKDLLARKVHWSADSYTSATRKEGFNPLSFPGADNDGFQPSTRNKKRSNKS